MSDPKDLASKTDAAELSDEALEQAEGGMQSLSNVMNNTMTTVDMGGQALTIDARGTYDQLGTVDGQDVVLRKRPGRG